MKRALVSVAVLLTLTWGARPAQAVSIPFIDVEAFGIELCQQSVCGAAIFVGVLHGDVGINPFALGTFSVAITHDPLPEPDHAASLTGGVFEFRVGLRRIAASLPAVALQQRRQHLFGPRRARDPERRHRHRHVRRGS